MLREDRAAWLLPWRLSPAAGGRRLRRALASFGGVADQEAEGIRRGGSGTPGPSAGAPGTPESGGERGKRFLPDLPSRTHLPTPTPTASPQPSVRKNGSEPLREGAHHL